MKKIIEKDYVICMAHFNLNEKCNKKCQWYHKGSMCLNGVYKQIIEDIISLQKEEFIKMIDKMKFEEVSCEKGYITYKYGNKINGYKIKGHIAGKNYNQCIEDIKAQFIK